MNLLVSHDLHCRFLSM
jgi:hypothetical protein